MPTQHPRSLVIAGNLTTKGKALPKLNIMIVNHQDDEAVALALAKALQNRKVTTWVLAENLLPGQELPLEASRAADRAHFILLLCSAALIHKGGRANVVMNKAFQAADEVAETGIKIIPIRLEECGLPYEAERRHLYYVDAWDEDGWQKIMQAFAKEFARREKFNDW